MRRALALAVLALLLLIALSTTYLAYQQHYENDGGVTLHVYLCAAGREAWEKVITLFEEETGIKVDVVYGSSGELLARIAAGAPADVYAPASPRYMIEAVERGLVDPSTVRPVAFLIPVIAVPAGNPANVRSIYDLARPGVKVALADTRAAAIGAHSVEILRRAGILDDVMDNVVAYADTFTRLVSLVVTGAVDATIAWHAIKYWYPDRVETIPLPSNLVNASWIPIAVTTHSKNPDTALRFVEFVTTDPRARKVFLELGYIVDVKEALEHAEGVEAEWLISSTS
ncbi:molybdate ABC transporter substrate-binding protein [Hyperthermus butylicus]|uniref:ABC-type molybdate transport system, periplasmic component, ModA n=1 Tax=Hyperthermus butylicus (strain DSM 5456 / JCM 9403 / PLM1-5) TaxID=415426 RepID=A2BJT5_HYPBU|nr:molybdate ABC transporter substrate-binding protein [Hyperthermus butylicus]ABM80246.1 ABC-type molybdate transport system, periplasmic component, ModA [Hyperthermus butylicus DSM 5456]